MKLHILAAVALVSLCCQVQAADRPAYSVTEYTFSTTDSPVSTGFVFTANQNVSVTALGYWDLFQDGLLNEHAVGIYGDDGTLLVSTIVASGDVGALIGEYRYAMLGSAFALTAGNVYRLVAHSTAGDGYRAAEVPPASLEVDSAITIGADAGRYVYSDSLVFPVIEAFDLYSTPNMLLADVVAAPVPEPETWALMLAGIGALVWVARRRSVHRG